MASIAKISTTPSAPSHLKVAVNQIYTYTKQVFKDPQKKTLNEDIEELTPFGTCLVSKLSSNNNIDSKYIKIKDHHETYVNCELVNNKLILSKASTEDIENSFFKSKELVKRKTAGTLKLRHFELCPAKDMSHDQREKIPQSVKMRNIGVAVAVILGKLMKVLNEW